MALAEGVRIGPYQVVAQIGAGGMGEVWKALDLRLGRAVALKVLPAAFAADPVRLQRFEQEARAVCALNHPNILTVHDLGNHDGAPFLVMELLEGQTLREKLGGTALPPKRVLEIGLELAKGLSAAHEKGIVHRDLKPENVFLTRDGRIKILDFGLAKLRAAEAPVSTSVSGEQPTQALAISPLQTEAGALLGTVAYMSPEQAQGFTLDGRSDIFSLGVVLWEMVAGVRPFQRDSVVATLQAIVREEPPDLGSGLQVPPVLERVLRSCLSKNPEGRFHSAHDLAFALQTALDGGTPSGTEGPAAATTTAPRRWPWAAAGLAALGLAAGLFFVAPWRRQTPRLPSVLALPAKVLGAPESAFLTDAIPSGLTDQLVLVEGLDTKLPATSFQVDKLQGDVARIAQAYQVEHLVLSTITAQGDTLVLSVKLAEAATQKVRWAGQFTGTRSAYLALIQEAAGALARVLRPGAPAPAAIAATSGDSELALALKEGQHYLGRYDAFFQAGDFERARGAFERVLAKEPSSAPALGNLAFLWILKSWSGPDQAAPAVAQAVSLARRALDQDPRMAVAWSALAHAEGFNRPPSLERALEYSIKATHPAATSADPGSTLGGAVGGPIFMAFGGQKVFEKQPLAVSDGAMAATGLTWQDKPQEALRLLEQVLAVEPGLPFGLVAKSEALLALGRLEEAAGQLKRCEPTNEAWGAELWRQVRFKLAVAQADSGTANGLADRAVRLWLGPGSRIDVNAVHTMPPGLMRLGRREDALRFLEKGMLQNPHAEGYLWVLQHPDLRPLRGDPRYERLVQQGRKDGALAVKAIGEALARGELPASFQAPLADLRALLDRGPG